MVQEAIETLIAGIGTTAVILREACELSDITKEAIADQPNRTIATKRCGWLQQ